MMKEIFLAIALISCSALLAQKQNYFDSLSEYQKEYVAGHEVVKASDIFFLLTLRIAFGRNLIHRKMQNGFR